MCGSRPSDRGSCPRPGARRCASRPDACSWWSWAGRCRDTACRARTAALCLRACCTDFRWRGCRGNPSWGLGRGWPVLPAPETGTEGRRPAELWLPLGVVARPARLRIDAREHLLPDIGLGVDEPDAVRSALEEPQVPVPPGMDQAPDRPSVAPDVDQEWRRDLVPVPRIVPVVLVVSLDLAGIRVKGDDGARVEIVAGVHVARPGRRIAGLPVRQVEVGIVVSREPDRRSTGLPGVPRPGVVARLAGSGDGVGPPDFLPGARIESGDVTADPELTAGHPDDDPSLRDERRQRRVVALLVVVDGRVPDDLPRRGAERHPLR